MAKSQSKYSVCAKLMNEALVALLEKKDFDYITIKEICKKAGVNRSTFYLHYENIYDLLQEVINGLNTQFIKEFNKKELSENIGSLPVDKLIFITTEYITPYLNFIKDNLKIFKVIYKNPALFKVEENYYKTYNECLYPIISRFNVPLNKREYYLTFYTSGVTAIVKEWIKKECEDSIEFITEIILDCVDLKK